MLFVSTLHIILKHLHDIILNISTWVSIFVRFSYLVPDDAFMCPPVLQLGSGCLIWWEGWGGVKMWGVHGRVMCFFT